MEKSFGFAGSAYNQVIVFQSAETLREVLKANPHMEPIIGAGQEDAKDFPGVYIAGIRLGTQTREEVLAEQLGEEKLSAVCRDLAETVRKHGLNRSPGICKTLMHYMSDVIMGWNCE